MIDERLLIKFYRKAVSISKELVREEYPETSKIAEEILREEEEEEEKEEEEKEEEVKEEEKNEEPHKKTRIS